MSRFVCVVLFVLLLFVFVFSILFLGCLGLLFHSATPAIKLPYRHDHVPFYYELLEPARPNASIPVHRALLERLCFVERCMNRSRKPPQKVSPSTFPLHQLLPTLLAHPGGADCVLLNRPGQAQIKVLVKALYDASDGASDTVNIPD